MVLVFLSWSSMDKELHLITRVVHRLMEQQVTLPDSELYKKAALSLFLQKGPRTLHRIMESIRLEKTHKNESRHSPALHCTTKPWP